MTDDTKAYALRLLAQRSYTTAGLRQKLLRKEFSVTETESLLARFSETGLLDDKKFALNFARARLTATSASPRRVRQLLAQKGIGAKIAGEAIARTLCEEGIDVTTSLERVARRKLASLAGLEQSVTRRRLMGFLARRGYDLDDIRHVLETLLR